MSKQDRQGVRTASDLERKYDFSLIGKGVGSDSVKVSQLEQTLSQHINETNVKFEEINEELQKVSNVEAEGVVYDNTLSRLTSDNVQDAIDELDDEARLMLIDLGNKVDKTIEYYGDMDNLVTSGFYRLSANVNLPVVLNYGQVIVSRGLDTASQIGISYHTGKILTRSCNSPDSNPNWTDWIEYATKQDLENIEVAGGFDLSYEEENEALTLVSNAENTSAWNFLTEKTGTTGTVTLPTEFSELHISIGVPNYMYTFDILAEDLSDTARLFRNGYCLSSSVYGDAYISVTSTQVEAWTVRKEGVLQDVTVKVYYK